MYKIISSLQQQNAGPKPIRQSVRNSEQIAKSDRIRSLGEDALWSAVYSRLRNRTAFDSAKGLKFCAKNQQLPGHSGTRRARVAPFMQSPAEKMLRTGSPASCRKPLHPSL